MTQAQSNKAATALDQLEKDIRCLEASLGPLPPPAAGRPVLVVVSGLPGSGKSYFARKLRERAPIAVLESDTLRKTLFPRPAYTLEESRRLFQACHAVLDSLLARGVSALLDATNLREIHRRPLSQIAQRRNAKLILVRLKAPPSLVRRRLRARERGLNPWDDSDAGVAVYEQMRQEVQRIRLPHITMDTSRSIGPALEAVIRQLRESGEGR